MTTPKTIWPRKLVTLSFCTLLSVTASLAHGAGERNEKISDERGLAQLVGTLLQRAQGLEAISDERGRRAAKVAFAHKLLEARKMIEPVWDILDEMGSANHRSRGARWAIQRAADALYAQKIVAFASRPQKDKPLFLQDGSLAASVEQLFKARATLDRNSSSSGSFVNEAQLWLSRPRPATARQRRAPTSRSPQRRSRR